MALPRMDSDPTTVDRVASVRPVIPTTTIAAAQARLQATGEAAGFRHDRFAVEWALPDDEIGPADVVLRLCDTDVQRGDPSCARCPVCDNHQRMQSAVTADGERYNRCLGCGLLWRVDRDLGRVVGATLHDPPLTGTRRRRPTAVSPGHTTRPRRGRAPSGPLRPRRGSPRSVGPGGRRREPASLRRCRRRQRPAGRRRPRCGQPGAGPDGAGHVARSGVQLDGNVSGGEGPVSSALHGGEASCRPGCAPRCCRPR